jgi:hypothetical protein
MFIVYLTTEYNVQIIWHRMVKVLLSKKFLEMCKEIILDYALPGCDILSLCDYFATSQTKLSPLFLRVNLQRINFLELNPGNIKTTRNVLYLETLKNKVIGSSETSVSLNQLHSVNS